MKGFLFRAYTGDGIELLLGGLCRDGWREQSEAVLGSALGHTCFWPCADPYLIDVKLHRVVQEMLQRCVPMPELREIVALAAVTDVPPEFPHACGAIIGAPFSEAESAGGVVEQLGIDCYAACYPGTFGAAFTAPNPDVADCLSRKIKQMPAQDAARLLRHTIFLMACDGGNGQAGALLLGDGKAVKRLEPGKRAGREELRNEADAYEAAGVSATAEGCRVQAWERNSVRNHGAGESEYGKDAVGKNRSSGG